MSRVNVHSPPRSLKMVLITAPGGSNMPTGSPGFVGLFSKNANYVYTPGFVHFKLLAVAIAEKK